MRTAPNRNVGPGPRPRPRRPLHNTTYTVTIPAACPTSAWEATYTISQVCSGDQSAWTIPSVLPNFGVTTVVCDVCEEATQIITCPNALGTEPAVINGNGVTMTAEPTRAAGEGYGPGFGPGHGHGHAFGPGGTEAGEGADGEVTGSSGAEGEAGGKGWAAPGTPALDGHSPVVTAGAAGLKTGLALVSGLVAVALGGLLVL
ncbi:hypothetical protein V8F33_006158 [Rhypophila sp. PSN 637]